MLHERRTPIDAIQFANQVVYVTTRRFNVDETAQCKWASLKMERVTPNTFRQVGIWLDPPGPLARSAAALHRVLDDF
jgi:hypothetical protein